MKETKKKLEDLGKKVLSDIEKKENPNIEVPIRSLSNIIYDKKTGMLTLGEKTAKRFLFHTGHAKKFMQTMLVAAFCKELLDQNLHTSLRDLFYALKRTLPNSQENTFNEQNESICPDEPLLVRIGSELKIVPGSDVLEFAKKTGRIVFSENGKEKISDVNLYVCAFDENHKIKEHKVSLVIKHPPNKVKVIKTASGREVKVTKSHCLFSISNGNLKAVKTSELKVGDWIALPKRIRIKINNKPINLVQKLMENAPENVLNNIYLKGKPTVIKSILEKIGKKKLKNLTSTYKNSWSTVISNWKHLNTIPLSVVKKSGVSIDEFLSRLRIGCRGSRHYYKTLIKKDENFGTILGYLLSEGSHSVFKSRNSASVCLSNSKIEILREFEKAFESTFGEKCAGKISRGKDGVYKLNVGYDTFSYILTYAIGYKPVRAWDKEIPSVLLDAPDKCVKAFLRSFRLGDGSSFASKFRIRYHTSSQKLVNGLVFLLLRLGVFPRIYRYKRKKPNHHDSFEIRVGDRECVKILSSITMDFEKTDLKRKHEVSSDRIPSICKLIDEARRSCKKKVSWKKLNWNQIKNQESIGLPMLKKIIEILKLHGAGESYINRLKQLVNSDIHWDKVISIEEAKTPPYTLDLAVNPTENFIGGNGFVILHNSDPIVVDLEVMLDVLREQLHLNADVRGRVVGDVIIRDRGDTIDWSKLGSGGWAIPSNVEDLEFKKVNANFILVIEKNAAFERLHEDKFWKKHKCILVTTQGQAARGTRRLIQRLATEFNLPVYVFTDADSIPPSEVVVVRDKNTKEVFAAPIGKLLEKFLNKEKSKEIIFVPWETLSMRSDGIIEWKEVEYAYRHKIKGKLLRIFTRGRGIIEVTPHHSLFSFKNGKIVVARASKLKEGDYLVVSKSFPRFDGKERVFYVSEILRQILPKNKWNRIELIYQDGKIQTLSKAKNVRKAKFLRHVKGKQKIVNKIKIDEDLAWLLGLWVAEGSLYSKYVILSLSSKEEEKIKKIERILKEKLNLNFSLSLEGRKKTGIRVSVGSSILSKIFSYFGLKSGASEKQILPFIFNSPFEVQMAFIKGLIEGDGYIDKYNNIVYFTKSEMLAKQLSLLLLSFGVMPTIHYSKGYYVRIPYTRMSEEIKEKLRISPSSKLCYTNVSIYGLPNEGNVKEILTNLMNNFGVPYSVKARLINQDRFIDSVREYGIPEKFKEDFENLKPFENMITLVKIKKIEEVEYEGDVFDLAVPVSNSFIGGNGIVFHNSYGWYIYSVIKYGSMSLAHVSDRLGTSNAKFLGLTISDIDKFGLKDFTIKAEEVDIKRAKEMLNYEWFKHPAWQKELKLMIERKIKAELEALSGKGLKFITENYLPEKIEKKDFLP